MKIILAAMALLLATPAFAGSFEELMRERVANDQKIFDERQKLYADHRALCEKVGKPQPGYTPEQSVASCWGSPQRINTTKTADHTLEQWVYVGGFLNFTDGKVTSVQTSR